ncbi:SGNH/GDSL hydrolase family protein [Rathayibacter soli]|uniref:SGNH/GDSL hydrolase family protein n=1 Tax=Rathayibacter soli TaxID=3144168 RepID=UPI0027E55B58|nr:SGNH/GDSL hydrolase family protein [Glaciibacter superstes]
MSNSKLLIGSTAAVAAVATAGVVGVRRFRRRMAAGAVTLNATLPVHSKWWRDTAKLPGELLYVAIGDSAAQGIGASAPPRGYVGRLADDIRGVTGRTVQVVNLSVSGATVGLAVSEQLPRFRTLSPDVVTVSIGANDIGRFDPVTFEDGLRQIFAALPSHAIVADLPCFYLPHNERKVAVANGILRRVAAERKLTVVPLHSTIARQGLVGMLTQFAQDAFHPNDRGYRVWAAAFEPTLVADLIARFPAAA